MANRGGVRLDLSAGVLSVVVALALVALKLRELAGTGALSVAASLADSVLDLMNWAGALAAMINAAKPADEDHAFGHTSVEDLASLGQSVFVLVSAGLIAVAAFGRLGGGAPRDPVGLPAMRRHHPQGRGWRGLRSIQTSGPCLFASWKTFVPSGLARRGCARPPVDTFSSSIIRSYKIMHNSPSGPRRAYRRQPVDQRRDALVASALALVAEGGKDAATVRAIASRAGVTPGLIRHHFATKEALLRESYRRLMEAMIQDAFVRIARAAADPALRLATFIEATLSPPVVDATGLGLWAAFIHDLRRDPEMREVHIQTYLGYRDQLQLLIAELPGRTDPARDRADAIACNGVIDGLWMEASAAPELFGPGEIPAIGLTAIGRILGVNLAGRLAQPLAKAEPAE